MGLFAVSIKKKIYKKNYFYCAEFVKYVLESCEIASNLPEIIRPENFKNLENNTLIYEGKLRNYNKNKTQKIRKIVHLNQNSLNAYK